MQFTFTDAAIGRLSEHLAGEDRSLRLLYDTEGCGCAVSGVPALQLVDSPDEGDQLGSGEPYPVWYQPQYEVFFEPRLRIDYDSGSFILKSDNQIYTTNLRLLK